MQAPFRKRLTFTTTATMCARSASFKPNSDRQATPKTIWQKHTDIGAHMRTEKRNLVNHNNINGVANANSNSTSSNSSRKNARIETLWNVLYVQNVGVREREIGWVIPYTTKLSKSNTNGTYKKRKKQKKTTSRPSKAWNDEWTIHSWRIVHWSITNDNSGSG